MQGRVCKQNSVRIIVFDATLNNISAISWPSVLLVEETGVPGENHRPVASHWQTLSHNVVSSAHSGWNWTNHIDSIVNASFKQVNVRGRLKFTLSKQLYCIYILPSLRLTLEYASEVWHWYFEREVAKHEKVQVESARIVLGLTNLQVEIIFTMIQDGNLCLVNVNIASWQHLIKCIINYILNTCVIVYLLQYLVSVIIISETMKTIQHQEVDSECLWHPLYHLLFHYGTT